MIFFNDNTVHSVRNVPRDALFYGVLTSFFVRRGSINESSREVNHVAAPFLFAVLFDVRTLWNVSRQATMLSSGLVDSQS